MTNLNDEPAVRDFWQAFLDSQPPGSERPSADFQAWSFGNTPEMADELGGLVLQGRKTATATLVWTFDEGIEPYPQVGDYHVVLDGRGYPICIIRTLDLEIKAFDEVGKEHAYLEGEGDRSLHSWRQAHWVYFTEECSKLGREPDLKMPVLCEKFALVYPQDREGRLSAQQGTDA